MNYELAKDLMDRFADLTGITGKCPPRRYLWTDAFAVCNFLGLCRETTNVRYLQLALELVEQVHHILGRHRPDDPRSGWISGLPDEQGEEHPTRGGLRIGKKLNERRVHEPTDARLEWDQDGQYFHYLTKWMHALARVSQETGEQRYLEWAVELAAVAHRSFTYYVHPGGPKRMFWKMSIDLGRPLVESMGHHDPLDGLITCLELQTFGGSTAGSATCLDSAIADFTQMCRQGRWATNDPLGIGDLLDATARLAQMVLVYGVQRRDLLIGLLHEATTSLEVFLRSSPLGQPPELRLPFRELGLSIGLRAVSRIAEIASQDRELVDLTGELLAYYPLTEQIETLWSKPVYQKSRTWTEHRDINMVMLATSLAPDAYLRL
jgi:hypothetical protein